MPTDPTPQAVTCKCGGNLVRVPGRWWVHQGYGPRCDNAEPAEPSPAPQAERVIEVAPQEEIPTAESAYEELIKNWRELYRDTVLQLRASDSSFTAALAELNDRDNHIKYAYDALGDVNRSIYLFDHIRKLREELDEAVRLRDKFQGALECANNAAKRRGEERDQLKSHYSDAKELIQRMMKEEEVLREERDRSDDDATSIGKMLGDARKGLRDMTEERDRAQEALRGLTTYFDEHYPNTSARAESLNSLLAAARAALNPASDRQPEGETK